MDIKVRRARVDDYAVINNLMLEVQNLHINFRPDLYKPTDIVFTFDDYVNILNNSNFIIAENDEEILGILLYEEREYKNLAHIERKVYFIDTIVVKSSNHKNGIGSLLVEYVKSEKRKNNINGIELQVLSKNVGAIEFYKKEGFEEKIKYMELK